MLETIMLLGTLSAILLGVGWLVGGIMGTGVALVIAVIINFVSYWYSDRFVLRLYKAKPLDNLKVSKLVKLLARNANIPVPGLYIIDSKTPNAFATGRDPKHSALAVTKGLLDLPFDELKGVLAHEIAHIRNRDVLVATMAATLGAAISYLAQIGYWMIFMGGNRRGEGSLVGLVLIVIFAPLAALLIRMAVSRAREYRADWVGALLTKQPKALASALRSISDTARHHPIRGSSATAHLWIVNPFHRDWFTHLFATHPPIEKRIERLEQMEPPIEKK